MYCRLHFLLLAALAATFAVTPSPATAQAFGLPEGVGSVTLAWQYLDNTGHRMSDGFLLEAGESVSTSLALEVDYGFTDRLSASLSMPYVFAKYTGALAPLSGLPRDACRCWQSSFQDFALTARYRFGSATWAVTPHVRYSHPTHDYPYEGEAVVGRNLREAQVGVSLGARLDRLLPRSNVQAGYSYGFVEAPLPDVSLDRSNGFVELGHGVTSRLYVRAGGIWQRTHGGLRFGSLTGTPFPPPGEMNTAERYAQRDRVQRSNYWHFTTGVSYSAGPVDVFASYLKYAGGTDTHDGQAYTIGLSLYFDRRQ
jgi:predicted porin